MSQKLSIECKSYCVKKQCNILMSEYEELNDRSNQSVLFSIHQYDEIDRNNLYHKRNVIATVACN